MDVVGHFLLSNEHEVWKHLQAAHTSTQSSCNVFEPLHTIPSRRLLWVCLRFSRLVVCFFGFDSLFLSASNSFEHLEHSNPPAGPVLLYAVTVNLGTVSLVVETKMNDVMEHKKCTQPLITDFTVFKLSR